MNKKKYLDYLRKWSLEFKDKLKKIKNSETGEFYILNKDFFLIQEMKLLIINF